MPLTREYIQKQCEKAQSQTHAIVSFVVPKIQDTGKLAAYRIALKDNISLKGYPMQAGSRSLQGYVPVFDATVVTRIQEEGGCIIAKTAMDELGMGGTGRNDCHGPVLHPLDPERIPGGSSSGNAALVACNGAEVGIGTDTGDSIRKPASYTGIVGLKPTYGQISRYGILPYASSMDTVGIHAQSLDQAFALLEVLQGQDPQDMMTCACVPIQIDFKETVCLSEYSLAVFDTVIQACDPILQLRFQALMEELRKQGVSIQTVQMPDSLMELVDPVYEVLANAEACSNHANLDGLRFGQQNGRLQKEGFSDLVQARWMSGAFALHQENQQRLYVKAQKLRHQMVEAYDRLFDQGDILLSLTTPDIAPKIENSMEDEGIALSHLKLSNFSGYPGLSIPLGQKEGMPFGLHLAARAHQEVLLYKVAKGIEACIRRLDHV